MLLRRLSRTVSRHYDGHLAACGLKTTQYSLLSLVLRLGPLAPGEIARRMSLDASTLTRNLKPMLAAGWLVQVAGDDGRSRKVSISPAGRDKRAEAAAHWKQAQLAFNRRVGATRVAALHRMVEACETRLAGPGAAVEAAGKAVR